MVPFHPAGESSDEEFNVFDLKDVKPGWHSSKKLNERLIDAAGFNDVAGATAALIFGADIHHRTNYLGEYSPIMIAAAGGCYEMIALLLEWGANIHDHSELCNVIMMLCGSYYDDEDVLCKCLDLLLENGADPMSTDNEGRTPLMYAVRNQHQRLMTKLLEVGCPVNMPDGQGWTALFHSVIMGCPTMTKMLIDAGGDVHRTDIHGKSLQDKATCSGLDLQALLEPPVTDDLKAEIPLDKTVLKNIPGTYKRCIYCCAAFLIMWKLRPIKETVVSVCSKLVTKMTLR